MLDVVNDPIPDYLMKSWDLVIIGEVLEHIDNPVHYLRSIREKYKEFAKQLVITVPNAFSLKNMLCSFKGIELINTDHRYWFSPYTLAKVGARAGFTVDYFSLCQYYNGEVWWKKNLVSRFPMLRDNLVMTLNF